MTTTNPTTPHPAPEAQLEPCPFCGSSNLHLSDGYDEDANWVVVCRVCRCSGTFCAIRGAAIARWNTRSRAPVATPPDHALVQLLNAALLNPQSAEQNIRQVIEALNAQGVAAPVNDAENIYCANCYTYHTPPPCVKPEHFTAAPSTPSTAHPVHDPIFDTLSKLAESSTVEQCPATCAEFPFFTHKQAHRCVLNAGHAFDPMYGDIHQFEGHETRVKPRVEPSVVARSAAEERDADKDPLLTRMRVECDLRYEAALARLLEQDMSVEDAERRLKQEGY